MLKYTKEQLQEKYGYELSLHLCDLLGYEVTFIHPYNEDKGEMPTMNVKGKTAGDWFAVDFGRPDCIMPLAFEHKISIIEDDETGWIAFRFSDEGIEYENANPLRAITCCLILVLQEKNNA